MIWPESKIQWNWWNKNYGNNEKSEQKAIKLCGRDNFNIVRCLLLLGQKKRILIHATSIHVEYAGFLSYFYEVKVQFKVMFTVLNTVGMKFFKIFICIKEKEKIENN